MMQCVEYLTREQVREKLNQLANELGLSVEDALAQLDRGELTDPIAGVELHMLRFLLEEPICSDCGYAIVHPDGGNYCRPCNEKNGYVHEHFIKLDRDDVRREFGEEMLKKLERLNVY